jgi:DMSO/TMAO reductase YedYZ molybdopterin-dependent catalytic subunit
MTERATLSQRAAGTLPAALAGVAAAALGLGVGELLGALIGGGSIVAAIGGLVIDLQPPGAKDLMVTLFGTNDKAALEVMVGIGGLAIGGLLGVIARRDLRLAIGGLVVLGLAGYLLITLDPLIDLLPAAINIVTAVAVTAVALVQLMGRLTASRPAVETASIVEPLVSAGFPRRAFLLTAGALVAVGAGLAVLGRNLGAAVRPATPPAAIPPAGDTVAPLAAGADLAPGIPGLTPIVVPNEDFYRIDTRLSTPVLDTASWSLRIHGLVDQEVTLSYDDLLAMPLVERYVTLACVSNEVGGYLVGNALWTGTPLVPLLEAAGVQAGGTQLVGRSFDGWTCGFPTAHLDGAGRESMIAVAMNGEPLPVVHGFPARLIVPGLYGYVSATKWLTEIELTGLDDFDAYWVRLGWAKQAPILTQSRIDVPRYGATLAAGAVTLAGVAWAPTRGISRVEVQLDDGDWHDAELSVPLADTAWVQWRIEVDIAAGAHTAQVRATDGEAKRQISERTPPAPDGARGYHAITFTAN